MARNPFDDIEETELVDLERADALLNEAFESEATDVVDTRQRRSLTERTARKAPKARPPAPRTHDEDLTTALPIDRVDRAAATDEDAASLADHVDDDDSSRQSALDAASPTVSTTSRIATSGERFAAFLLDILVLFAWYFANVQLYHFLFHGSWDGTAPTNLLFNGLMFHGQFLLQLLAYFTIPQTLFGASFGQWCCGLVVRKLDGQLPPWSAVLVRNLLLPIDLVFCGLIMEWSSRYQRLGDMAAGTTVVKLQPHPQTFSPVAWSHIARTISRVAAGSIDAVVLGALTIGLVLQWSPDREFFSQWLLILSPFILIVFWSVLQRFSQSTPGGFLLGYRVVQEHGAPISLSHAILRTITLPIDLLGIGVLAIALSPRRQRVGDLVAGTLVVQSERRWEGSMMWLALLLLCALLGLGAWRNATPLITANLELNPDFRWTFVPRTDLAPNWPPTGGPTEPFSIRGFRFAEGRPENSRSPATFVDGETVYLVFEVHGFSTQGNMVWVQEDLTVRYPDGSFGLKQENIIDYHTIKRLPGPLQLTNQIFLPPGIPAGQHTVYLTIRDKLSGSAQQVHTETFLVKAPLAAPVPTPTVNPNIVEPSSPDAQPTATSPALPTTNDEHTTAPGNTSPQTVPMQNSAIAPPTLAMPTLPATLPAPAPSSLPASPFVTPTLTPP